MYPYPLKETNFFSSLIGRSEEILLEMKPGVFTPSSSPYPLVNR